ncbi:MAG: hypothetical protein ACFFE2_07040 [Candidatus Thorarchaeota archaeon]
MKREIFSSPIIIHFPSGESKHASILFDESGPGCIVNGQTRILRANDILFSATSDSTLPLHPKEKTRLLPLLVLELGYDPDSTRIDVMYPPSSKGWFPKVVEQDTKSIFTVQEILGRDKLLLTITNQADLSKAPTHILIHPYEFEILRMKRDFTILKDILQLSLGIDPINTNDFLDAPPPNWAQLSRLVENVTIPFLKLGKTMRDTMQQLVPVSFTEDTREQIMTFFAWIGKNEIPDADPAILLESRGVFHQLMVGYLQCLIEGVKSPEYVRIMLQADRGDLSAPDRPKIEAVETNPWHTAWLKIEEGHPDWMERVIAVADKLNKEEIILTQLPVSANDAKKSTEAWKDRFALVRHGFILRGIVHKERLGLKPVVYVGRAHRWPHKHLELSVRLGYSPETQTSLQVMVLPQSSVARIARVIPRLRVVDWEMNWINLPLYKGTKRSWALNSSQIFKSLERTRSLRQLRNEFQSPKNSDSIIVNRDQAKALDLISWGMYLRPLELFQYSKYYELDNSKIKELLEWLQSKSVVSMQYFLAQLKTRSVCILAEGPSNSVCSLTRAFLKHAPSAYVRMTDDGSSSIIIARIPEDEIYNLTSKLPEAAIENDVALELLPVSAYVGYRNNLFQRLLRSDGTWDDDTTGLLSQVRLRPKVVE